MKISSINFIREDSIPQRSRTTENTKIIDDLVERFKKVPAGQGLSIKVEKLKKHHSYQLQKALQKRGLRIQVVVSPNEKDTMFIRRSADK